MLELVCWVILGGLSASAAKELAQMAKPNKKRSKKGNAKPVSDFRRRKAASKSRGRR